MTRPPAVRPYRDRDLGAVYDVCVRTGAAGQDARGRYSSDDLLGDVYAGPYLHLEPELAFVVDDGDRVVGYVLGTADTARFVRRYRTSWLPRVSGRHPAPVASPTTAQERLVVALHRPERMLRPEWDAYPAHLHIDLLPAAQGGGFGRALMERFLDAAARAGAGAVHLGMAASNAGAGAFYTRLGFHGIDVAGDVGAVYFGRSTTEPLPPRRPQGA